MALTFSLSTLNDESIDLKAGLLVHLTGLTSNQITEFNNTWGELSETRKYEIITRLNDLTENNLELDFSAIFRSCLRDGNALIREQATKGLWEHDDRIIIQPLVKLLTEDICPSVRVAAAESLGRFAFMAQEDKLSDRDVERVRDALFQAFDHDRDIDVSLRAFESLACFNTKRTDQMIIDAYTSGDVSRKRSAIYAMGRTSNPRWLPSILAELDDKDPAIRFEATTACGLLGEEETVPHLISLINDEDIEVQISAIKALGATGGKLAQQALLKCVEKDDHLSEAAQDALNALDIDTNPLGSKLQS